MPNVKILQQNGYSFLWIDDILWMWDLPFEVKIQQNLAKQAFGDVCVVGLGLGVIQRALRDNRAVNTFEMLTIEKHKEVWDACNKQGIDSTAGGGLFICDFFDVIPGIDTGDKKFDFVIGDIWPEIGFEYLSLYKRFKTKAMEFLRPEGKILAWGMDYYEYLLKKEKDKI